MTKVSIVVPVYNVSQYLKRCLDTLVNQTLNDIEIIIVNDGSTDESPKICEQYSKQYKNIKYISQDNQGLSAARNAGIKIATGEFIGFVDSDDFVEKDMYEFLYKNAIQHNADISCCGHMSFYENEFIKINSKKNIKRKYNREEALDIFLIQEYFDVTAWNKIYKRELFKNVEYPKGKIFEDIQTIYKLIDLSNGLYFDSTPKYYYFQRLNSISHGNFNEKTLGILDAVNDYVKFCDSHLSRKKYLYIGEIRWNLVVVNKMILANEIDFSLVQKVKNKIGKRIMSILLTNKLNFIRKTQIFLFWISFHLYKKFYMRSQNETKY